MASNKSTVAPQFTRLYPLTSRIIRIGAITLILAVVIYLIGAAAIYMLLERDPNRLVDKYLGEVSARTGLKFTVGGLDLSMLPVPSISLTDISVVGPQTRIAIAWAQITPNFTLIFSGGFFPGTITLLRPRVMLSSPVPLGEPSRLGQYFTSGSGQKDMSLPTLQLDIMDLNAAINGSDSKTLSLTNMDAQINIWSDGKLNTDLRFATLRLLEGRKQYGYLENFTLAANTNVNDFLKSTENLEATGIFSASDIAAETAFSAAFNGMPEGWQCSAAIDGALDIAGIAVPLKFNGAVSQQTDSHTIDGRDLNVQLGPDSGKLSLVYQTKKRALGGTLEVHRASLPQWLGFARNLPPGLQLALDNITNGRLEFTLDDKGLSVPSIKATCAGFTFTGNGGVPDWKKPVVTLNMESPYVDLVAGLPESAGITPRAPWYAHQPLTPMPGEPLKPGETGIGYDIRLKAKKMKYGHLDMQQAELRIHPGKLDISGLEDVLLDGSAAFYKGNIRGTCILGADPSLPLHISASAKQVDGKLLSRAMPIIPVQSGIYESNAVVTSRGKTLDKFLANLEGAINISSPKTTLGTAKTSIAVNSASARFTLAGGALNSDRLSFKGSWKASLATPEWETTAQMDGPLIFSGNGLAFNGNKASIALIARKTFLPPSTRINISGKFSGNTDNERFSASDAVIEAMKAKFTGAINYDGKKQEVQGQCSANIPSLQDTLTISGFKNVKIPQEFNACSLQSPFTLKQDTFSLTKLTAKVGKLQTSGNFSYLLKSQKPKFNANLNFGHIDVASLLPKNKTRNQSWNYPFMKTFDASGSLSIARLDVYETQFKNMHVAYNLANGKLSLNPVTANFYGAPLKSVIHADFNSGVLLQSNISVNSFDLAQAVRDLKLNILLSGHASAAAKLSMNLTGNAKPVNVLDGVWNFTVLNGSWQSLNKKKEPTGSPMKFAKTSATGTVKSGLVKSQDFMLASPDLNVDGSGWINLATKKIDCTFNVNMKSLPNFPIYVFGPLDNPKKNIGAGKMILNAVGGVANGFVNAIGGFIKGTWNIFTK